MIILLGAIGDVVRKLPLLGRIRRGWPNAHIAWAVEPKSSPIIEGHPWLDELIIYDRRHAPWSFVPFLQSVHRGRFDMVIDLQRHLKSGIIGMASGASNRIGFPAANTKEFNHRFTTRQIEAQPNLRLKLMQYQAFADAVGLPPVPIEFGLSLPPDKDRRARAVVVGARRPLVGVILGSSMAEPPLFSRFDRCKRNLVLLLHGRQMEARHSYSRCSLAVRRILRSVTPSSAN